MIAKPRERKSLLRNAARIASVIFLTAFFCASALGSRQSQQPPKPPSSRSDSSSRPSADQSKSGSDQGSEQQDHRWDPFNADQDVQVGLFYMHKGDYDAAIGRFQHAIQLSPKLAKPRYLLGEAYQKKDDKQTAIKYYKEYLQVFPDAPDAKKVQKKIEKLSRQQ